MPAIETAAAVGIAALGCKTFDRIVTQTDPERQHAGMGKAMDNMVRNMKKYGPYMNSEERHKWSDEVGKCLRAREDALLEPKWYQRVFVERWRVSSAGGHIARQNGKLHNRSLQLEAEMKGVFKAVKGHETLRTRSVPLVSTSVANASPGSSIEMKPKLKTSRKSASELLVRVTK
ncbi:hypothetical protein HGRIS_013854 [Hohenbuehelia grisea]|uniref:Uncharacterized protein n=1 Tax=Hohenbuehelia grisea TaxID=104357 RepID=A0ABR3IWX2_9AGAR